MFKNNLVNTISNLSCPLYNKNKVKVGIADTGETKTMVTPNTPLNNITNGPRLNVVLPDDSETISTKQGNLQIKLPTKATTAHIVQSFKRNLVAIPQVVDAGYHALFTRNIVLIINDETRKVEWRGIRNNENGLWELPLQQIKEDNKIMSNNIKTTASNNLFEHIQFLYQACGSPVKSTWIKAINNNHFKSWPNLTVKNVNKYLEKTIHSLRGHMQQTRKFKSKLRKK